MSVNLHICWICNKGTAPERLAEDTLLIVLEGENHITRICNKCAHTLLGGKQLSYKRILPQIPHPHAPVVLRCGII